MSILDPWSDACGAEYVSPVAKEIADLEREINAAIRKTRKGHAVSVCVGEVIASSLTRTSVSFRYSSVAINEAVKQCEAAGWFCAGLEHSGEGMEIRLVPPGHRRPSEPKP